MSKNLIMGVAKGYGWDTLEPFVTSWADNCPRADLVLFVDDISDFTRNRLIRSGALLVDIPAEYKDVMIIHSRWKMFADFLEAHGATYEQIFVTDTRDVIFQGNVFAAFAGNSNWLGYATYAADIGGNVPESTVNYKWLAGCFGKTEADKLAGRQIICCGTVIGSVDAMKIFCRVMWTNLKARTVWGDEQALRNYLVYNGLLPIANLIETDVHSGEIYTNSLIKDNKIRDDKILRGDGGVPAVVHQYDRHAPLVQLVDELYRAKDFVFDGRFTDMRSTLEQVVCLIQAGKTVEATRLFMRQYLSAAPLGKHTDALVKIWELSARKPLTPTVEMLEAALQDTLSNVEKFSATNLSGIFRLLTAETARAASTFRIFFANYLLELSAGYLQANDAENCLAGIRMIEALNMPPDKNFYLFAAKANRVFGRKAEALTAYKRALELS